MDKIANKFFLLFLLALIIFQLSSDSALAKGWWGDGYKTSKWVLKNGGTIIRFKIEDISGDSGEYKVVMYDKKGKFIEVEDGTKGFFDDAKDNIYEIKAHRGIMDTKMRHNEGKSFAKIKITAHPGETIWLKFNYKKKKVTMTTDYVKPLPKPVKKPVPAPQPQEAEDLPQIENELKIELEGEMDIVDPDQPADIEGTAQKFESGDSFIEGMIETAEALTSDHKIIPKQEVISEKEGNNPNILKAMWEAVIIFFAKNKKVFWLSQD